MRDAHPRISLRSSGLRRATPLRRGTLVITPRFRVLSRLCHARGSMDHRLGVDIGGTFTDVALDSGGRRYTAKVLTTSAAPERGVLEAIRTVLDEARVPPAPLT